MTSSEWTVATLHEHYSALREADARFAAERDRRYAEVDIERERAMRIKETADLAALELARTIQTYKDEKANELREQINSERGLYATKHDLTAAEEKIEATLAPVLTFIASQQGRTAGLSQGWGVLIAAAGLIVAIVIGAR